MRKIFFLFMLLYAGICPAQSINSYGLAIIDDVADYKKTVHKNNDNELVEIKNYIPNIKLDIRYAGTNNFSKKAVYNQARAFARLPVVKALALVQQELNQKGLSLKIYDAYRPYAVTVEFFETVSDKNFVAHPKNGSRHNRGCAIDLTIVKLKNGRELKMPTSYDSFAPEASPDFKDLPVRVIRNRDLLIDLMSKHGFSVLYNEWWHFDFRDWKQFDLMDIPFKQL
ncbi:M15 family metallopeptidase [Daejeonella oryzae]|uniref:M15 family metallopeptidase n=1 Tax=Daejeonella oryzae TaxID=1122943 RepID=UPI000404984D|nr:M15 family metallopeptidase [Daejeonella oryzae]